jgi:hypothetical protein
LLHGVAARGWSDQYRLFFTHYDAEGSSTKVFQEMVNQLSKYLQTTFISSDNLSLAPGMHRCKLYVVVLRLPPRAH